MKPFDWGKLLAYVLMVLVIGVIVEGARWYYDN